MALYKVILFAGLLALAGCKQPLVEPVREPAPSPTPAASASSPEPGDFEVDPTPIPSAAPETTVALTTPRPTAPPAALIATPDAPLLTPAGRALIYEFEVGGKSGYDPRPEAPDARISGITWGIGYDAHQNAPRTIEMDWSDLGMLKAKRLADTHPYYGRTAQAHLKDVRDILVSWELASDIFDRIDVGREFDAAHRLWPGFDQLRPNAQAALISNGFNRGWSVVGENRKEMKEMRRLVPLKDYKGIAAQMRMSERVWRGTSIYNGLRRRRFAEAVLIETP